MGCVFANEFSEFDGFAHTKEFQVTLEELKRLSLSSEDVRKLFAVFNFTLAADDDRTTITLTTLLLRLGIPYTAFAHEVFTIFSPGRLDFRALALTVWNYCTLTIENMRKQLKVNFSNLPVIKISSRLLQICSCSICTTRVADPLLRRRCQTYSKIYTEMSNRKQTGIHTSNPLIMLVNIYVVSYRDCTLAHLVAALRSS